MRSVRPIFLSLATNLVLSAFAIFAHAETVDRKLDADPKGKVKISNIAGSVVVTGGDRSEVHVTGSLGEGVERLDLKDTGRWIAIKVVPQRGERWKNKSADLRIEVPRGSEVDVEVVSASAEVHDIDGEISIEAVSGDVEVDADAQIQIEVVSGDVEVRGSSLGLEVSSVSGDVSLSELSGDIEASSVSGNLELDADELEQAELETVSGNVRVSGHLAANGTLEASSHSGNVTLTLPASTSARFEVETHSGSISNDLSDDRGKKELDFTLGGGDGEVEVETFSGDVRLKNL